MLNKESFQILFVEIVVAAIQKCGGKLYWSLIPLPLSPDHDYMQDILNRERSDISYQYLGLPTTSQEMKYQVYSTNYPLSNTTNFSPFSIETVPPRPINASQEGNRKRKVDPNSNGYSIGTYNMTNIDEYNINNKEEYKNNNYEETGYKKGNSPCDQTLDFDEANGKRFRTTRSSESHYMNNKCSYGSNNSSSRQKSFPSKSSNTDHDLTLVSPLTKENIHVWECKIHSQIEEIQSNDNIQDYSRCSNQSPPCFRAQSVHNCTVESNPNEHSSYLRIGPYSNENGCNDDYQQEMINYTNTKDSKRKEGEDAIGIVTEGDGIGKCIDNCIGTENDIDNGNQNQNGNRNGKNESEKEKKYSLVYPCEQCQDSQECSCDPELSLDDDESSCQSLECKSVISALTMNSEWFENPGRDFFLVQQQQQATEIQNYKNLPKMLPLQMVSPQKSMPILYPSPPCFPYPQPINSTYSRITGPGSPVSENPLGYTNSNPTFDYLNCNFTKSSNGNSYQIGFGVNSELHSNHNNDFHNNSILMHPLYSENNSNNFVSTMKHPYQEQNYNEKFALHPPENSNIHKNPALMNVVSNTLNDYLPIQTSLLLPGGLNKHSTCTPLGQITQHKAISNDLHCCT
jgi:hypothetical protein